MTKKSKIILSTSVLAGVATIGVLTPLIVTEAKKHNNSITGTKFSFNGKEFNSKQELEQYAMSLVTHETITETNRESWSIKFENEIIKFKSFDELMKFVKQQVKSFDVVSSQQFDSLSHDSLSPSDLSNLELKGNNKTQEIYKGINDQYFLTEEEAKLSYLQMHNAYYFNGLYFRNKQELANYLNKNFDDFKQLNPSKNTVSLVSSDNIASRPFSRTDLYNKQEDEIKEFTSFVTNNSKKYLKTTNDVSKSQGKYKYIDVDEILKQPGNI